MMTETTKDDAGPAAEACRHHWRIAAPEGTTSRGVCKHCGAERDFPNASDSTFWETTMPGSPRPLATRRAGNRVDEASARARRTPPTAPPEGR